MRRFALTSMAAGAFLLALCVTCFGIRRLTPFPDIPQVGDKLAAYGAAGREIDTLFFGSSRVYHGINPRVFDEVAREHGVESSSYNLGIDAMTFPESEYYCEKALALRPGRVHWVLMEITRVSTEMPPQIRGTRRASYWHDFARTMTVARSIFSRSKSGAISDERGRALLAEDVGQFFQRCSNFGQGADLLQSDFSAPPRRATGRDDFDPNSRGYSPMPGSLDGKASNAFQQSVTEANWKNRPQTDPATEEALRDFNRRLAKNGATVILVITPGAAPTPQLFGEGRSKVDAPEVLSFDDPEAYPELYRADLRADAGHLNDAGARKFTALISQRVAELKMRNTIPSSPALTSL